MDWLSPLVSAVVQLTILLWSPVSRQVHYVKDLNENMETLMRETEELVCIRDAVQARLEDSASSGRIPLRLVQNWLKDVGGTIAEVDSIASQLEGGMTRCCCADLNSRRKLGKRIVRRINDVTKLKGKGNFTEVAQSPRRSQIPEQQELEQQRSFKKAPEEISLRLKEEIPMLLKEMAVVAILAYPCVLLIEKLSSISYFDS